MVIRMNKLLEQAQSMKKKLESLQEELKTKTVEATSGGGIVSVTVNGEHAITAPLGCESSREDGQLLILGRSRLSGGQAL